MWKCIKSDKVYTFDNKVKKYIYNKSLLDKEIYYLTKLPSITPKILHVQDNYYIMEKIPITFPRGSETKFITLEQQKGIYELQYFLINHHNIIHMDSHLGNYGFNQFGQCFIFDFEFAQTRLFTLDNSKKWALAFSLAQCMDFWTIKNIQSSLFWPMILNILTDDKIQSVNNIIKEYRKDEMIYHQILKMIDQKQDDHDLLLGCICYYIILSRPLKTINGPNRFADPSSYHCRTSILYKTIINIQRNKY